jgi:hypothetical protein
MGSAGSEGEAPGGKKGGMKLAHRVILLVIQRCAKSIRVS